MKQVFQKADGRGKKTSCGAALAKSGALGAACAIVGLALAACAQWMGGGGTVAGAPASDGPPVLHLMAADGGAAPQLAPPALTATQPANLPGLPNVVAYAPGLIVGGKPEGREGFETLKQMGITQIIDVDGEVPDLEDAKAEGLPYIHLPIGYNGMDEQRALEIAKAISEAHGPVYVHCHLGKHRSATAAAEASVMLGLMSNDEAIAKMRVSGTSPSYTGLFQCVEEARPTTQGALDKVPGKFPELWKPTGLVQSMDDINLGVEHLKAIEKAGWKTPAGQPDLVPAAEAGKLSDLFRDACGLDQVKSKSAEFSAGLLEQSGRFGEMESALTRIKPGDTPDEPTRAALSKQLATTAQSCVECHAKYRDLEKPVQRHLTGSGQ